MLVKGVYDIEKCEDLGYTRIKLEIAFQNESEGKILLNKILVHNKIEGAYSLDDVTLVAYLRKDNVTGVVTAENELISAYITDIGELSFSNTWLTDKAIKRCIDYASALKL